MIKIIVISPSGNRRFSFEFAEVEGAKKLLDVLHADGFESARQYASRISNTCRICAKPLDKHIAGGHKFIPLTSP